jgi:hypothetical protein
MPKYCTSVRHPTLVCLLLQLPAAAVDNMNEMKAGNRGVMCALSG